MKSSLKRFIVKITALTVVIAVAGWLAINLFIPDYYLPVMPWLLLFFLVTTLTGHAYQLSRAKKGVSAFTRSSMLVTFLRLIIYSVFAVVYIAIKPQTAVDFVVCLLLLYLIYTYFEVKELLRISKKK